MRCPLRAKALQSPDQFFLISASESLSFQEADVLCGRYQAVLEEAGISSGERVAHFLPNSPEGVCFLFACLRQQLVLCPLNARLPERGIHERLDFLGSETFYPALPKPGKRGLEAAELYPEKIATLLFTSGSSGQPKLISHSLENHLLSAESANRHAPLGPGDRWRSSLPFYHVGGLAIVFRCVLAGAAMVFSDEVAVTHLSLVPTQLIRMMRGGIPKGLKRILLGGAPLPQSLIEDAQARGLPIAASYGMTETASQIAATPPGEKVQGAGRVMSHAEVKISEEGEIWVRGGSVSKACLQSDGWLHTGDKGRLEDGMLFVEGRMDRQFISGGENIQPEQIEKALLGLEGVSQAVVVAEADAEFGYRPVAWVDKEFEEAWNLQLRERLPGYMIPVRFEKLPEGVGLKPRL
ncbi:AMP-binding protein [Kiritimatiellaeota bacterium B1221]|nr:AMP-binding protein [Kiritimatiellaeota bacterium B1221]